MAYFNNNRGLSQIGMNYQQEQNRPSQFATPQFPTQQYGRAQQNSPFANQGTTGYQPAGGPYGANAMFSQQSQQQQQNPMMPLPQASTQYPQQYNQGGLRDIGRRRRLMEMLKRRRMMTNFGGQNGQGIY